RQTSTRASALERRSASATPAAATIGTVASSDTEYTPVTACALSACTSTPGAMIIAGSWRARGSFALGAEPFDDAGERGPFVGREGLVGLVEQRGDGRCARAVEECSYEMSNSGPLGDAARRGRVIDVARALFFVPEMALLLEDAEQRAHRGGARRIGDLIVDLGRRGVTAAVDDVHDLPFAAAELRRGGSGGHGASGSSRKVRTVPWDKFLSRGRNVKRPGVVLHAPRPSSPATHSGLVRQPRRVGAAGPPEQSMTEAHVFSEETAEELTRFVLASLRT